MAPMISTTRMMQDSTGFWTAISPIRSRPKAMLAPGGRSVFSTWTLLSLFF
jgi:hypothetical protein